ncbi:hypothetical protein QQF64_025344 [Cirrhinus molitorella]|uniref:Uncharacterized protein n=1 Tax=Cirrhinus molitorella TaxID=172907 RepID=A0ABR3NPE5_9TELE
MTDDVNEQMSERLKDVSEKKGRDPEIEGRRMNTAKTVTYFHALTKKGVMKGALEPKSSKMRERAHMKPTCPL